MGSIRGVSPRSGTWRTRGVLAGLVAATLALALAGCSNASSDRVQGQRISTRTLPKTKAPEPKVESIFDAEGVLKPSGQRLGWLELPMGFTERKSSQGTHHAYVADVPVEAITRFFDRRVLTGKIDIVGKGVQYVAAGPKTLDPSAIRFNIGIYPAPRGTRVQLVIDELTTGGSPPLSEEAARALISQMQQRAE